MPSSVWLLKRRPGLRTPWLWLLRCCLLCLLAQPASAIEYSPLPSATPVGLSSNWLIYDAGRNALVLYLPGYHAPAQAYYQWVEINPARPLPIAFTARKGLSVFLDNRLIFTASRSAAYTLELNKLLPEQAAGRHLLCIWHPQVSPNYASFTNAQPEAKPTAGNAARPAPWQPQTREVSHQGENVFLGFLLLIGLLYGGIRTAYPGFARIYQLWSTAPGESSFLTRPTITWLNLVLILVFSLSLALLLVAIHTNVQNVYLLRRLFAVTESDIVVRILIYALLISAFVLLRFVFLGIMGYIFDLSALVVPQYREFVRSLLFMGLFLPGVMLLYLTLNQTWPQGVIYVSNAVVTLMLLAVVFRVANTLNQRVSLLNLHLFSYFCATEIIPLMVLLKILVFTY